MCPILHYSPNKLTILSRYYYTVEQERKKSFLRKTKKHLSAFIAWKSNKKIAELFQDKMNSISQGQTFNSQLLKSSDHTETEEMLDENDNICDEDAEQPNDDAHESAESLNLSKESLKLNKSSLQKQTMNPTSINIKFKESFFDNCSPEDDEDQPKDFGTIAANRRMGMRNENQILLKGITPNKKPKNNLPLFVIENFDKLGKSHYKQKELFDFNSDLFKLFYS
jgi:hypothetical protein